MELSENLCINGQCLAFYRMVSACMRVDGELSENFLIGVGVR